MGKHPSWLADYDLCSPWTAFALGPLRHAATGWMRARDQRALFLLPFFLVDYAERWKCKAEKITGLLGVDSLLLLLPDPTLERSLFHEVPQETWHAQCASALWDIPAGKVLWADGLHTRETLSQHGLTQQKWLQKSRLPRPSEDAE